MVEEDQIRRGEARAQRQPKRPCTSTWTQCLAGTYGAGLLSSRPAGTGTKDNNEKVHGNPSSAVPEKPQYGMRNNGTHQPLFETQGREHMKQHMRRRPACLTQQDIHPLTPVLVLAFAAWTRCHRRFPGDAAEKEKADEGEDNSMAATVTVMRMQ